MHVHKALLISTTCQRLGLGLFICSVLANAFLGAAIPLNTISLVALVLLGVGGIASAFHLGRPGRFFNAFSNFGSHLTQEAAVTPFLGIALLIGGLDGIFFELGSAAGIVHWISVIIALAFLISTGLVYQLNARPAWNTPLVLIIFLLTAGQIGSLATVWAAAYFDGAVSTSLLALTIILFIASVIAQFAFVSRLKGLGYGVAVQAFSGEYKSVASTWLALTIVVLACTFAGALGASAALALLGVAASIVSILAWTVLFYKVALKVKMFPMYPVELNVYM